MRHLLVLFAVAALLATATTTVAGTIDDDLTVTGTLTFVGADAKAVNSVNQTGTLGAIEGGSTSSSAYSGTNSGDDLAVTGSFTDFGDGFTIVGDSDATADWAKFALKVTLGMTIVNTSLTDEWVVGFAVDLDDHYVNADVPDEEGAYALADSRFVLKHSGSEVFASELRSETVLGDGSAEGDYANQDLTTYGAAISEEALKRFYVTVGANSSVSIVGDWILAGEAVYDPQVPDFAEAGLDVSVTLYSASSEAAAVPLPPAGFAGLLMLAGIFGLKRLRRRR